MDQYDKAMLECRDRLSGGAPIEEILTVLRDHGVSKAFSIRALAELGVTDLGNAKKLVHFSKTWSDVRTRDDRFHESLSELEQDEGPPRDQ
jgi:hypothetical protein